MSEESHLLLLPAACLQGGLFPLLQRVQMRIIQQHRQQCTIRPAEQPSASQSTGATPSDTAAYCRTSTAQEQSVHDSTAGVDNLGDHRASPDAPSAVQVAAGRRPSPAGSPSGARASESQEVRAHRTDSRAHSIVPEFKQTSRSEESSSPSSSSLHATEQYATEGARELFLVAPQELEEQGMRSSAEGDTRGSERTSCHQDETAGAAGSGEARVAEEHIPQDGNGRAVPPLLFNSYALQGYILICCQVSHLLTQMHVASLSYIIVHCAFLSTSCLCLSIPGPGAGCLLAASLIVWNLCLSFRILPWRKLEEWNEPCNAMDLAKCAIRDVCTTRRYGSALLPACQIAAVLSEEYLAKNLQLVKLPWRRCPAP